MMVCRFVPQMRGAFTNGEAFSHGCFLFVLVFLLGTLGSPHYRVDGLCNY
jgi:hypothetical protein